MKLKKLLFGLLLVISATFSAVLFIKPSNEVAAVSAADGKATKDYPMLIQWWDNVDNMYVNNTVAIHCWGGDLTTAKTVPTEKITNHMAAGVIPKGTLYFKIIKVSTATTLPCDGWPSGVASEWGQWTFDSTKNVVELHYYNGDQVYSDNKAVLIKDRPVFFDTSSYGNWFADNATAYAVTGAHSGYDYSGSEQWNKLTRIGTSGYMYFIPSSTIVAPQVVVTRNNPNLSGWSNRWNQTTNMTANYGFNPLYTTMVESGKTGDNYNWGNKSAVETASEYGCYFMDKITCDGLGSITSAASNWTTVENTYNGLTKDVQGECWKASGNSSGNNIEKAMLQYDYIVFFKQYSGYNDFINRSSSEGKSYSSPQTNLLVMNSEKPTTVMIITVISLVSVSAIGGFFFIKKRKETN